MGFHAIHRTDGRLVGCQHLIQVAKTGKQGFSQRLNVSLGNAVGQQQFEQRLISARGCFAVKKPLPQSLAVTGLAIVAVVHNLDTC